MALRYYSLAWIVFSICVEIQCFANKTCNPPVSLGGEWGKIKTAVVGNPNGAHFPHELPQMLRATLPQGPLFHNIVKNSGRPLDPTLIVQAAREIEGLAKKLQSLGVQTLQPQVPTNFFSRPIRTKAFQVRSGLYAAMPRDNLLLLPPNLIVLAPMAWRSRYREHEAYRDVLHSLTRLGFKVVEAPRPTLADTTYVSNWQDHGDGIFRPVINNQEPLFDAADFIRLDGHIIGQLSHVTNRKGIQWIRSTLDPKYRLHIIEFADAHPMHIDATLIPLTEGKILVNPERVPQKLRRALEKVLLQGWDMIEVPTPQSLSRVAPLYFTSSWINMNILVGENWAIIEAQDAPMAALLRTHKFEPIPLPFQHFQSLGGSFHCCTLDIRENMSDKSGQLLTQKSDLHIYVDSESGEYNVESLQEFLSK